MGNVVLGILVLLIFIGVFAAVRSEFGEIFRK